MINNTVLKKRIQQFLSDVRLHVESLSEIVVINEEIPDIEFILCDKSPLPYQMFDHQYSRNGQVYNKHYIAFPLSLPEAIQKTLFHSGMSVLEYEERTQLDRFTMTPVDYFTSICIHELAHVYQLYIQHYNTEEQHTTEFYRVLDCLYDKNLHGILKNIIVSSS